MRKIKFKVVMVDGLGCRTSYYAQGKYSKIYNKGEVVTAEKHTIGIAVFKTKQYAEKFQDRGYVGQIIRVEPIGRGKTFSLINGSQGESSLDSFYQKLTKWPSYYDYFNFTTNKITPPEGTIFYPAVKVLD